MHKHVGEECLKELGAFWSFIKGAKPSLIQVSENHTYNLLCEDGRQFIARFTPKNQRTKDSIKGEINFITTIQTNSDLYVCNAIESDIKGEYIKCVIPYDDNSEWWVVLFTFAGGKDMKMNALADNIVIAEWGRCLGKMHRISSNFGNQITESTSNEWKLVLQTTPHWSETHSGVLSMKRIEELAKCSEKGKLVLDAWKNLIKKLDKIPKDNGNFGPIHGDLHNSNFFVNKVSNDKCEIHIFDFDQMQMNYFGCGVGGVIQRARFHSKYGFKGDLIDGLDIKQFEEYFLKGYESEFGEIRREDIDLFVDWRELYNITLCLDVIDKIEKGHGEFDEGILYFVNLIIDSYPMSETKGLQ